MRQEYDRCQCTVDDLSEKHHDHLLQSCVQGLAIVERKIVAKRSKNGNSTELAKEFPESAQWLASIVGIINAIIESIVGIIDAIIASIVGMIDAILCGNNLYTKNSEHSLENYGIGLAFVE